MKSYISWIFLFAFLGNIQARNFEGVLTYFKESGGDTIKMYCFVKGNKVRIEEYNRYNDLQKTLLIDIERKSAFLLSPDQKLYTPYLPKNSWNCNNDDYQVIKSENYRIINQIKCYQWRVRNLTKNTEITYWVARDSFLYFDKLVNHLDPSDKSVNFFTLIPDNKGFFPVVTEEKTLVRDQKNKTSLINIKEKTMSSHLFMIPSDYKLFVL